MPSFDIVSEIEIAEVKNAVENSMRELDTRFDFRGVDASFEYTGEAVKISAEAEFQLQQLRDILRNKITKRGIDPQTMDSGKIEKAGKTCSQIINFKQGIDKETAKKITKLIKEKKLKVQASIQGEKIRVNGKKRDDLQETIALIKESDLGQPFQYENFRD